MGNYIVKVTSGSDVGTVENQIDIGLRYTDKLNDINEGELKFSGTGAIKRGLLTMGAEVEISRNGDLEFKGIIDKTDSLDAGGQVIHISGFEIRLVQEKGAYANSPWVGEDSVDIAFDIISESNYYTDGIINAGANIDFRLDKAQSLWSALGNLSTKTGQDIQIRYDNDEVNILDHRGSTTSVATLNDGIHIKNIRVSTAYPKGNWVKVYGKGDGENQIESDDAQGVDAGSQSTYGIIKQVIIDRSIISVAEANARANIEVPKIKDPLKVYDFEVMNLDADIDTGDVITLNSQDKDLDNEEVRVVGKERGIIGSREYLSLQVTNSAFSTVLKTSNQLLGELQKSSVDSNTYMQGSGNTLTWERGVNAKDSSPLAINFQIPATYIEDEIRSIRINSFTIDYDVDPYKKGVGSASDSGHVHAVSSSTTDNMSMPRLIDDDSWSENLATTWDLVKNITIPAGSYGFLLVYFQLFADGWSGIDVTGVKITVDGTPYFQQMGIAYDTTVDPLYMTVMIPILAVYSSAKTLAISHYSASNEDYEGFIEVFDMDTIHTHDITALTGTESSTADVSIGDDISDAGSINATEVDIYLDFWNGSAWINKHSIMNTGKTLENDVDVSDSGTYPDAAGLWRIRIATDSADPDYVQTIVKIKHLLDNK